MNIDWRSDRLYAEVAPPAEEAIAKLRGNDPRPLLIVRDTQDEDIDALLQPALKSERFTLASRWFHCVKIDVKDADVATSQYANVFGTRDPAHIVLSTWDGAQRVELLGTIEQRVTWEKIQSILAREYKKNAYTAIKGLEKLLSAYDALDQRETELRDQLTRCKEAKKADQVQKLEAELADVAKQRKQLDAEEKALLKLELKRAAVAEAARD